MNKTRMLLFVTVCLALLLVTTRGFASPAGLPYAQNTHVPKTPGAHATENAVDKATRQAGNPHGKHENFKGTVSAVDQTSITLTLRDGSSVTVGLSAGTRIQFPGPKGSSASIQAGMTAMVQALRDAQGNLVARRVMIIPGKPSKIHRVGTVTAYTPGSSITIQDKQGGSYTFTISAETIVLPAERASELAVGRRVTIIAPRDPATGGVMVRGIVIHPAAP